MILSFHSPTIQLRITEYAKYNRTT